MAASCRASPSTASASVSSRNCLPSWKTPSRNSDGKTAPTGAHGGTMPEKNKFASVDRLAALLNLLSDEWEEMHALIPQLDYPPNDESAQRAFRRDIAALQEL